MRNFIVFVGRKWLCSYCVPYWPDTHQKQQNHMCSELFGNIGYSTVMYRARPKSKPLGKIRYLWQCSNYIHQICKGNRGGFIPHICKFY